MRIIAIKTIRDFWEENKISEQPLKSWIQEAQNSKWSNSAELKEQYRNASVLGSKRVVFNIKGNDYRLIVDIEYRLQIIFVVWLGTHEQYDKINAKKVKYVKSNKK